ncbi:Holliday junction resolvase YqgF [Oleidesulfovibrio alaskensis G20]|jgi:putative Holliday junction resolvase|uniref:Putative pre-16S rRNA nuclease n=1 Tax=Oleidesulfovibrio alaskensis (strain ATCC BAA-1058 / DSM 17464 / G20) TaxID=207559 RepID=YQGF_OLEA2|nr:Holliday junction resolvase RuvX [Oleidesulfovibrio alaskensis]Q316N1.1 RecName: Full=Putative pre-16S rRNA nuclease [Oleidesulfovibrio alaskensis G20]ABB37115.1 Holliday junction resolvase YqgF [Oleidesulfovibrio alaskensis G20]MBG0774129.1 Holliday junction resolvase RuvX [Oleidesulfovibrio alaskensis]MBL3582920.1 Holliday junction resolvase RuvX [Oleidesulfovibrio alaskensis]
MKYLGIDYGTRRTGIAVTDGAGMMAFPRRTIVMSTRDAFFAELLSVVEEERPAGVVVGLPLLAGGEETLITRQVRNFVARLRRRSSLPVYLVAEELSSFEAGEDLREAGLSFREREAVVDQQAAVRILESFLNLPEDRRIPLEG